MSNFRMLFASITLLGFVACKVPEQRRAFYPNGYLKERYWVYQESGSEVMDGLYTAWYPNGHKEVEILYVNGDEITKTYYSERGTLLGTVNVAAQEQ